MMIEWCAAFFICGLIFSGNPANTYAPFSIACALALLGAVPRGGRDPGRDPGRRRLSAIRARFLVTCAVGLVAYSSALLAVTEHGGRTRSSVRRNGPAAAGAASALRGWCLRRLEPGALTPLSSAMIRALLLADRSGLPRALRDDFAFLGVSHFLALSGLHLGIIALPVLWLARIARLRRTARECVLLVVLAGYAAVAGFPPSLKRALVMLAAVALQRRLGRRTDIMHALLLGTVPLVAVDTRILFDTGFRLSFTAVSGIALVGLPLVESIRGGTGSRRVWGRLLVPVLITASVQLFTAPLLLRLFHRVPSAALLMNLVLLLPVTALVYGGLVFLCMPGWIGSGLIAPGINAITGVLGRLTSGAGEIHWPALMPPDLSTLPFSAGMILIAASLRRRPLRRRIAAAGCLCVLISFLPVAGRRGERGFGESSGRERRPEWPAGAFYDPSRGGALVLVRGAGIREAAGIVRDMWEAGIDRLGMLVLCQEGGTRTDGCRYILRRMHVNRLVCSPYLVRSSTVLERAAGRSGTAIHALRSGEAVGGIHSGWMVEGPAFPPRPGGRLGAGDTGLVITFLDLGRGRG